MSDAQETLAPDVPIQARPPELETWIMQTTTLQVLPPATYPADQLLNFLPPHAAQLLTTDAANGPAPALDIIASRIYDVSVSDRVHQLKPNSELHDTTRYRTELPFPGL